jgi:superfamily II DNA/RNA helicase
MDKDEVVGRILQAEGRGKTVIFTKTKRQASKVSEELVDRGFNATALHGDMTQEAREKSMAAFRSGKRDILVATEVAARGIDVDDVTHVINYTIPEDEKAYLHRVGRTGRAGRTGIAVTFVDWEDLIRWGHINTALEFGQPDPTETYSSSAHLFEDMNIAAGTKGRIAKSKRPEGWKPGDDDKSRGSRDGGRANSGRPGGHAGAKHEAGRSRSDRDRNRGGDKPHAAGTANEKPAAEKTESHGGNEHPRPSTPRTRNRTRGGRTN